MAAIYNDNAVQYGSRVLTINAIAYVADSFETNAPSVVVERTNELGEPSGSVGIAGFVRGTATIQLASATHTGPALGNSFATDTTPGATADSTYYITDIGLPQSSQGEFKVNISFIRAYA